MTIPDLHFLIIGCVVVVAAVMLLLVVPALEHWRWSRRKRRRIGWYS
jgi:Tfp pilus assembly protein FimT